MKKALYVGSFDPITLGHLDIVRQALLVFDRLYVFVGINPAKDNSRFTVKERCDMIGDAVKEVGLDSHRVTVGHYDTSMMEAARHTNVCSLVRGLRQISDFGDEFKYNGMVARALPETPMTYFICRQDFLHVSSSSVKEMHKYGEDISWMVTTNVVDALNGVRED